MKPIQQSGLHLDLPVKFTKVGAEFPEPLTQKEFDLIGAALAGLDRVTPAWIGDYLNAYEVAWGERYAQATVLFHKEPGTLRNYKWIYGQIDLSLRNDKLHHSQYAAIVSSMESRTERKKWIEKCAENDWDTQKLKDELRKTKDLAGNERFPKLEGSNDDTAGESQSTSLMYPETATDRVHGAPPALAPGQEYWTGVCHVCRHDQVPVTAVVVNVCRGCAGEIEARKEFAKE